MKPRVLAVLLALAAALEAPILSAGSITITCDNDYDLYVDGVYVGSQNNNDGNYGWGIPETWGISLGPGWHTIAVAGRDESAASGTGIGLIAVVTSDLGFSYITDGTWKVESQAPAGWQLPSFDDSQWRLAFVEGPYDSNPWGSFAPPMTQFAASGALWIWRDNPPYYPGYGFYNTGAHQFCWFRKQIFVNEATPAVPSTWGRIKNLAR